MGVRVRYIAAVGAVVCLAATASAGAASAHVAQHKVQTLTTKGTAPLATAISDPWLFNSSQEETAFAKTRAAGASYVRLNVSWSAIAPGNRPDGFVATDPTSPGYSWGNVDAIVERAEAAGPDADPRHQRQRRAGRTLKKPKGVNAGTPKAADLGRVRDRARDALRRRESLRYRSPGRPHLPGLERGQQQPLPRPGGQRDQLPQHAQRRRQRRARRRLQERRHRRRPRPVRAPEGQEAEVELAGAACLHALAALPLEGSRIRTRPAARRPTSTSGRTTRTRFNGPFGHARNPDDISLGDLPKMKALLNAGVKLHRVVSPHAVKFWVTEFSWDTNPPRRHAAPSSLAARWTAEAFYQMWRSGVSLVTWFGLQDRGGSSQYQSGLYRHSKSLGKRGGQARADRIPLPVRRVPQRPQHQHLGPERDEQQAGRHDPAPPRLERASGPRWRRSARTPPASSRERSGWQRPSKDWLRASAPGSGSSLAFSLTRPSPKLRYGPWGN